VIFVTVWPIHNNPGHTASVLRTFFLSTFSEIYLFHVASLLFCPFPINLWIANRYDGITPFLQGNQQRKRKKCFVILRTGVDVMITIFCDFCQFSAKKWRFSQTPML
jgi:hypothetical protein